MKRVIVNVLLSGALFFGVAFFGRKAIGHDADHGLLRMAWRTSGEKVRICKELSAEEKAKIPIHMRRDAGCVSRVLPYRLHVSVDGKVIEDRAIVPAGIHGDRPLYVQAELARAPGPVAVHIEFAPELSLLHQEVGARDPAWEEAAARAPRFTLDRSIEIQAGRIALVALDRAGKELVVYGAAAAASPTPAGTR